FAIFRTPDCSAQILATSQEVALGERNFTEDTVTGRIAGTHTIVTSAALDDGDVKDHTISRAARSRSHLNRLEEAQCLDIGTALGHQRPVERIAFGEVELAANDIVAGLGVA